ncbi:MAG: hypothetical protein CME59_02985 [Halioglobus sp.]|nr:hypothetical protein [Halioglobus sp.]|tara:strand:+ start:2770 stop:3204 length:435 start_codon:yes stop_codon:yes gene_type:complete
MLRPLTNLSLALAVALGSACASKQPRPEPTTFFSTSITEDGGKFFVYRVELPEREERAGRGGTRQGGDRGRRGGPPGQQQGRDAVQRDDDALKQQVDRLIAENRFCRDGYFVLDQYSGAGGKSLRGECREGASPEDRIRFPNPV